MDCESDVAVLGVGALGEAIVTGLSRAEQPPSITISGRSPERSSRLATTFETVTVAADNQTLIDAAPTVILCVRPQDVAVVGSLRFGPDQTVISAMAAIDLATLAELVAPATCIARVIPMPSVADGVGPTPAYPVIAKVERLFAPLGGVLAMDSEAEFDAISVASATVAAHLEFVGSIASWLEGNGIPRKRAVAYLAGVLADIAGSATDHATPGGLNERFAARLREAGVYSAVTDGLDDVLATVRSGSMRST